MDRAWRKSVLSRLPSRISEHQGGCHHFEMWDLWHMLETEPLLFSYNICCCFSVSLREKHIPTYWAIQARNPRTHHPWLFLFPHLSIPSVTKHCWFCLFNVQTSPLHSTPRCLCLSSGHYCLLSGACLVSSPPILSSCCVQGEVSKNQPDITTPISELQRSQWKKQTMVREDWRGISKRDQ